MKRSHHYKKESRDMQKQLGELRAQLVKRLTELMADHPGLDTQTKVSKRADISQSSVQRILAQEQAATVDVLEKLAHAFGLTQARHILLNDDEIGLLERWNQLQEADKTATFRFMDVSKHLTNTDNKNPLNFKLRTSFDEDQTKKMVVASNRPIKVTKLVHNNDSADKQAGKQADKKLKG